MAAGRRIADARTENGLLASACVRVLARRPAPAPRDVRGDERAPCAGPAAQSNRPCPSAATNDPQCGAPPALGTVGPARREAPALR